MELDSAVVPRARTRGTNWKI